MSKGDKPRPMAVKYNKFVSNWNKAFGNQKEITLIDDCGNIRKPPVVDITPNNVLEFEIEKVKLES